MAVAHEQFKKLKNGNGNLLEKEHIFDLKNIIPKFLNPIKFNFF